MRRRASHFSRRSVGAAAICGLLLAGCGQRVHETTYGESHEAVFTNGNFQENDAGTTPPVGWTVVTALNPTGVSGTTAAPPASFTALNLTDGGMMETYVLGGAQLSQSDPDLGTGQTFRYPLYGTRAALINYEKSDAGLTLEGANKNANYMEQSMVVSEADVDPTDGQVHVRMAVAPVLENPAHTFVEQPYFYVQLNDLTQGTILDTFFNVAGQSGVPWNTTTSLYTGNETQWLNWSLIDISPSNAAIAIGDTVQIILVGSGCSLGGHFGRLYVDGLGATVPGPYVEAYAASSVSAGSTLAYTLKYAVGGTTTAIGTTVSMVMPPNTTFASVTPPTGVTCTSPAVGSANSTVSCAIGTLAPGSNGSIVVTVTVLSTATGTITNGNYQISSVNEPTLLGGPVHTAVISSSTTTVDISATNVAGESTVNWGGTVSYTLTITNNSTTTTASGVSVSDIFPSQLTGVAWSCMRVGGAHGTECPNGHHYDPQSGTGTVSGNISGTVSLLAGGVLSFTVTGTVIAGSGLGSIVDSFTVGSGSGTVDPNLSNNTATSVISIGTPETLTVSLAGATADGIVMSAPTGISCGATCTDTFAQGQTVVLSAAPIVNGATFTGWSGACSGTATTCTVTMSAAKAVTATFAAPVAVGAAADVYAYSGTPQNTNVSTAFPNLLQALVTDANGNPISGKTVTFTAVPVGGASATLSAITTTSAAGIATATATANATAGTYTVTASVTGVATPATFTLTNVGGPATITYVAGGDSTDPQSAPLNSGFPSALIALVSDSAGHPVTGATVTFTIVPAGSATCTLSSTTATTGTNGYASVTATAGTVVGNYTVTAKVGAIGPVTFYLDNVSTGPAAVYVVSGNNQVTPISAAFPLPLLVVVSDALGNSLPNITVTFAAPGSGASATLSATTATTNSLGEASITATANATAGYYGVTAKVAGVTTPATFTLGNDGTYVIGVNAGGTQTAQVGTVYATTLQAVVTDSNENPVSGVTVTFTATPVNGASANLSSSTATTNTSGIAAVTATANTIAGAFTVTASTANALSPATYYLTNTAGPAATVTVVSGSPQSAVVDTAFGAPLEVIVKDSDGNPVSGSTVTFAAPTTGATAVLSTTSVTTDATGTASIMATAGTIIGTYDVTAKVGSLTAASFVLTNTAGTANAISIVSGNTQSVTVATAFTPLVVEVEDFYGNPVPGIAVTFTPPGSNPTALLGSAAATGINGETSVTATAGTGAGSYAVTAAAAGVSATVSFSLTNKAGAATSIAVVSGTPQSKTVSTAFSPLVVLVSDTYSNPVSGVTVTFTPPSGTGVATATLGTAATTGTNGQTQVTATANSVAGSYTVSAAAAGVSATVPFALTNTAAAAATITVVSGTPQTATVNTAFSALIVKVTDAYGNAVSGNTVTFTPPSGTGVATATLGTAVVTGSNGQTSVTASANTVAGGYTVSAAAAGVTTAVSFSLTNTAGAAASIAVVSGTPQSATVNNAFAALVVKVTDTYGNPVSGNTVTFTPPGSGVASVILGTAAATGSTGQTSVTATANTISGSYTVSAAAAGVSTPVSFSLTNNPGAATTIAVVSGTPQSTTVKSAFSALIVEVTDKYSNPVPGIAVTFTPPSSGASAVLGSAAVTGPTGQTSVTASANTVAGAYTVSASAAGVTTPVTFSLTNTAGAATTITVVSGTPQTTTVNTGFSALVVQVSDTYSNPVSGVTVTFTPPASGASANLGVAVLTGTNGQTSVTASANLVAGSYMVSAAATGVTTPISFTLTNTAGAATSIAVVSGTPQTTTVNTAFSALVVKVTDTYSNPVSGVTVTFTAPSGGASATLGTAATTGLNGQTSVTASANTAAGSYFVSAAAAGVSTPVSFSLTNTAGAATSIAVVSGTPQTATVNAAFSALVVKVTDTWGNPVPGVAVTFTPPSSGASASLGTALVTGTNGQTSVTASANTIAGNYTVSAAATGVTTPVTFSLTNAAGTAASLAVVSGTPQTTTVNTAFSPLVVKVSDTYGNAVSGATVTFTPPGSGVASAILGSAATTSTNGQTSVTASANTIAGSYTVSAAAAGVSSPVTFSLTNTAGAATSIAVVSGTPQTTTVNTAFSPLVVKVTDTYGNAVSGNTVTFTPPASGASAMLGMAATTGTNGQTNVTASANTIAGNYAVSAAAAGVSTPVTFSLTNTAGAATAINVVSGTPQTTTVNAAFSALVVKVTDTYSNPVSGITVTFTPPGSGVASASLGVAALTGTNGETSVTASANTIAGNYTVSAAATGVTTPVTFSLTNTSAGAASIAVVSGTPQSTTVNTAFSSLVVKVTDTYGNAVSGVVVTFTPPGSGASASLGTAAATTSNGQTSVTAAANTIAGSYTVSAAAAGVSTPVTFSLTNTAGGATTIAVVSGTPQTTTVSTAFSPLVVKVTDTYGNPIQGNVVTFTAPGSGASAILGTVAATGSSGQTSVSATANTMAGGYIISAAAAGVSSPVTFSLTNTAGTASAIAAVAGTPQSTPVNTAFTPLVVLVTDAYGNPVQGSVVTMTPPGSGVASAILGSAAATGANGQTSVTATANTITGSYLVSAAAAGVSTPVTFSLTNTAGAATAIAVVSGTPQTTTVNTAFSPLVVKVTDTYGNAVPGVTVTFTPPATGATAALGTASATGTTGQTTVTAAANTIAGSYSVTASAAGVSTPVTFTLTNTSAAAATIAVVSGTPQSTTVSTAFSPLIVKVTDTYANPVTGVTVTFTPPGSGASAALGIAATTGVNGETTVTASANTIAGSYAVSAAAAGVTTSVTFSLTNTAASAASIAVVSGTPQTTTVKTAFSALAVKVTDAFGNPVSSVAVTFTPPATGASATLGTAATTDLTGQTNVTATANTVAGSYTVTASIVGVTTPATFSLTNTASAPASLTAISGTPQSTTVGTSFGLALLVQALDQYGNPVPQATVTFTPPASGASASLGTALTTNALGETSVSATANTTTGAYTVMASVNGSSASFLLTNTAATPSLIRIVSGDDQSTTVNTAFTDPLIVQVLDRYSNPVSNVTVTFTPPTSGATATATNPALTDATGETQVTATAGLTTGNYAVNASVPGVSTPVSFSLTNTSDVPASVSVISGNNQSTTVGTAFAAPIFVEVDDQFGNPVPIVTVTFTPPTSGPTATLSTPAVTGSDGQTSVTATASVTPGAYTVSASVPGATAATVSLNNTTGSGASITVVSGTPQGATVGSPFSAPLVVLVVDQFSNPVSGTSVSFSVPGSGASASLSSPSATGADGMTSVTAVAGTIAGAYSVVASVSGVGSATFSLSNLVGAPNLISLVSGDGQTATVDTDFAHRLVVRVFDVYSNPVPGTTVTFFPPTTGPTASLTTPNITDSTGRTSVTATAGTVIGQYFVTASVAGVSFPATFSLTNTPDVPASITAISGTPQSTVVHASFAAPLIVEVADRYGNPVPEVTVTFAAPASGTSAAVGTPLATDGTGQTSANATANTITGSYTVNATVAGVTAPAAFALTNTAGAPASITAISGTPQSATVGVAFGASLLVQVLDQFGNPVPGASVTFTPPGSGATASLGTPATTDSSGETSVTATANTITGSYSITALVNGISTVFALTNTSSVPTSITIVSGNSQSTTVDTAFSNPLVVQVSDRYANPVPAAAVTFAPPAGGATATLTTPALTDTTGKTSVTATAGTVTGGYLVSATVAGVPSGVSFSLTNTADVPATIVAVSGTPQTATVNTSFALPLVVLVSDRYSNPVPGATVTFTPPGAGASAALSTPAITDATGQTNVTGHADNLAGAYTVSASVGGVTTPAGFLLTNAAGVPANITVVSGTPQTTTVKSSFSALVVLVSDSFANPVPNATVTFGAPTGGASATLGSPATTDTTGETSVSATANAIAGSYTVSATVGGVSTPAAFQLTNTAGAATSIAVVSGTPQTTVVNTAFSPLVVKVTDADSNPVPGATVTFLPPAIGATATLGTPPATDSSGETSVAATANTVAGVYTIDASVSGVTTPAAFSLTNAAAAPASITAISGTPQSTTVGTSFSTPLLVQVLDQFSNPVPNATVTFTPPGSGATATIGTAAPTNSTGRTSVTAVANDVSGTYTVTALVNGVSVGFVLTNTSDVPASIKVVSGGGQSTTVNTGFGSPLVVQIFDRYANLVPGATVTFSPPASGATAILTTPALTDISGETNVAATAGTVTGSYLVTATVTGVTSGVTFPLTNTADAPATIVAVSGTPQTTTVDTSFALPLEVEVSDQYGNPVPGATVTFTPPGSGASAALGTPGTTDSSGQTNVTALADDLAGVYTVNASVSGVTTPASFSLTNAAGVPSAITIISGSPQTTTVKTAFNALLVQVTDTFGNPVPGVTVTYAAPATGASATLGSAAITNATGETSVSATANTIAGSYTATATVGGVSTPASFLLTNTAGAATSIAVVSGTPQTTTVKTAFSPLVVKVTDAYSNPVPSVAVSFAAPPTGASAILGNPATTDASGQTSVAATANALAGGYVVRASAPGVSLSSSFVLTNAPASPASIVVVSGNDQSATVNTGFADPLVVQVFDAYSNPVPGVTVSFTLPASGASAIVTTPALTDATGSTSVTATAGLVTGDYTAIASVTGAGAPATFTLTNTADVPATIVAVSGTPQVTVVHTAFSPLVVLVTDQFGNPVPDATVSFTAPATGASAHLGTAATTGSNGETSVTATANHIAGSYSVNAAVAGVTLPAVFALTNAASAPASITVISGSPQSTIVQTAFGPLVALVADTYGNPVPGASVTFASPGTGASAALGAATTTGVNGETSVSATANTIAGSYAVTASVGGVTTPASFLLTNTAGQAASIAVVSGTPQSTTVNTVFSALVVKVTDQFANPVPSATVTFTAPASGASALLGSAALTDATGETNVSATANTKSGAYTVTATVTGTGSPASFSLTNTAGAPASITAISGTPQSMPVGVGFELPLAVQVLDQYGNPVPSVAVTFTPPASGASANLGMASVTDSNGDTSVAATANTVTGSYAVTASVSGFSASFLLTNTAGVPASIKVVSGDDQSATVDTAFADKLVVQVFDTYSNPVPGISVTLAPPNTGATATTTTPPPTDSTGSTSVTATAGTITGSYTVTASVANVTTPASFSLTNTADVPAKIVAQSGTPQSATVNTAFNPLVVQVTDQFGNAVPNATVAFTPPASSASANLGTGALTDTTGQTSVTASANTVSGGYVVTAAVAGVTTPASFALTNTAAAPASILAVSGTPQSATVGTTFGLPLLVQALDQYGNPAPGATITFAPPSSGATATLGPALTTNGLGQTSVSATANTVTGSYVVTATVSGFMTSFLLTNTAAGPVLIKVVSGDNQSATVNTAFANPLIVQVLDTYSNPVPSVTVTFAPPTGGATATISTPVGTGPTGETQVTATASTVTGTYTLTASVAGVAAPVTFSLTNTADVPATIVVVSGGNQSATVATAFGEPVVVEVEDLFGNPVPGVDLTFAPPASGASAAITAPAETAADGTTSVTATANTTPGAYSVTITVPGATPASVSLNNATGNGASITIVAGNNQTATVGASFGAPLVVLVTDQFGNPVAGNPVTFTAPGSGARATLSSAANTNASGMTSATAVAGTVTGSYSVTATASGVGTTTFSLTNSVGAPTTVLVNAGAPQSATVNTAFAEALVVQVLDVHANPVAGVTVTFTPPLSGATATLTVSALTGATGQTSVMATAGTLAGSYSVTATVNGVSSPAIFQLTNTPAAPATITAFSGTPQSATVNTAFAVPLVVLVEDLFGNPVPGAAVTFTPPASGSSAAVGAPAVTNSSGQTSANATANTVTGSYSVTASVAGVATPASFLLANTASAPASITAISGTPQSATVNTVFAMPLLVQVLDQFGNPAPGIAVTFTAPMSASPEGRPVVERVAVTVASASLGSSLPTGSTGETSVLATANTVTGSYAVAATVGALSASFALTNAAAAPASLSIVTGNNQSTTVNTVFANPLVVQVLDTYSNPVPGVSVTFTPPTTGASASLATSAATDRTGRTSTVASANTITGPYLVTASVGAATPVSFSLSNTPAAPASVVAISGTPQSTTVGTAFVGPLVVQVEDQYGNPVPGVTVTYSPSGAAASASLGSSLITGSTGETSVLATANNVRGQYVIQATVGTLTASFVLTNTAAAPATLLVVSGNNQSTTVKTTFANPLQVQVLDTYSNPVPGVSLTFAPPSSGASASVTTPAVTDATGSTSVAATADSITGQYVVSASVGAVTPVTFTLTNTAAAAASIVAVSGAPQTTTVSTAFQAPLVVLVADQYGNPVPGATVAFTTPASGAAAVLGTIPLTGSAGETSVTVQANTVAGSYNVSASVGSVRTTANFSLTNTAGAPASVVASSGTPQSAIVKSAFSLPLLVQVLDQYGNPVPGVGVSFTAPASGATATLGTAAPTGSNGETSVTATANRVAGGYTITASAGALSTTFVLTNTDAAPASISAYSGGIQSATVNTEFAQLLVVKVVDKYGNPVPGISVMFTPPDTGATAAVANPAPTDVTGTTSVVATAGTISGTYVVNVSVQGVNAPASFILTNTPGAPAFVTAVSGTPQTTTVATAFQPLTVLVTDAYDNPVPGISVAFSSPGTGASASLGTAATTDDTGETSVMAAANTFAGAYAVTATTTGVSPPASFTLTNAADAPASLTAVSGTPQSTTIGAPFPLPLVVRVLDQYGNAVPGVDLTVHQPGAGASATIGAVPATNSSGETSVTASAGYLAGGYTVTVSVNGITASFVLTNTAGAPATIKLISGNDQSTPVATDFADALVVQVLDADSNPVPGIAVTFTPPASGAGASLTVPSSTDATGKTHVTATAASVAGSYEVTASVTGVTTPVTFSLENTSGGPATIVAVSGTPQTTTVATAFSALVVQVADQYGNPVPGATVTFAPPASGASATLGSAGVTDSSGQTNVSASANTHAGSYQVFASVSGASAPVGFALTNAAGLPASITPVSGTPQNALVGVAFGSPLVVQVLDQYGNPVPGSTVVFGAPGSGPTATLGASATTDVNGNTSVTATANTVTGGYTVTATVNGIMTTFSLANTAAALASIKLVSGNEQSTIVATAFGEPLVVQVLDVYSNPVPGVTVTFTPPSGGASATATSPAPTDVTGQTSVTATAGTEAGSYSLRASVSGLSTPVVFSLTNTASTATAITVISGSPQSTPVATAFGALVVLVADQFGNPVPGATVTFLPPSTGAAAVLSAPAVTDVTGQTNVSATANTFAGTYSVTANVLGIQTPASFSLTNTAGAATTLTAISGTPQSTAVNTSFVSPLVVQVSDTYGNPVPGAGVTFTPPGGGATATLGSAPLTNVLGQTQVVATAGTVAGSYAILAAVTGASSASFALSNTAGTAVAIAIVSGNNQSDTVNTAFNPLVVRVVDQYANPVAGVTVTFTTPGSGASAVLGAPSNTGANGQTSITAIAGTIAGAYSVSAAAAGVATPVEFSLTNLAGPAATLTVASGNNQSAVVDTAFAAPVVVEVDDQYSNPVSGIQVTFAPPTTGASATLSTPTETGVDGRTSVTATANATPGAYQVTAAATGATGANILLNNAAGAGATITIVSGNDQSTTVGTSFSAALAVKVEDHLGNPVSGVAVSFTAPGSEATATLTTAADTDATGESSVTALAGTVAGAYSVTVTASGVGSTTFSLTNDVGLPATVSVSAGNNQTTAVNTSFSHPLVVKVVDQFSNPVPTVQVMFTAPGSGATATLDAPAPTNALGETSVTAQAGATAGTYSVVAKVEGAASAATFTLMNASAGSALKPNIGVSGGGCASTGSGSWSLLTALIFLGLVRLRGKRHAA